MTLRVVPFLTFRSVSAKSSRKIRPTYHMIGGSHGRVFFEGTPLPPKTRRRRCFSFGFP